MTGWKTIKTVLLKPERNTKPEQRDDNADGGGCSDDYDYDYEGGGGDDDDVAFSNMLIDHSSYIHIFHSFSHCCLSFFIFFLTFFITARSSKMMIATWITDNWRQKFYRNLALQPSKSTFRLN
jgi:hypothetical protein